MAEYNKSAIIALATVWLVRYMKLSKALYTTLKMQKGINQYVIMVLFYYHTNGLSGHININGTFWVVQKVRPQHFVQLFHIIIVSNYESL